jgi:hypothetical protein
MANWFTSFLHPEKGYEKGQEQLDKYYQEANNNLQPYNQNGQNQYNNLNDYIMSLMNPEELQNKWISGYSESPAAKNAENLAQEHGVNAASSLGLGGSNTALHAIQQGTSQIGLNDRQNYLNDLMKKYMEGAGIAQSVYGTGANAATGLSNNAMNMGQNSANMSYGAQNAGGNMLSGLIGTAGGVAAGALGGPIGGALSTRWNLSGGK